MKPRQYVILKIEMYKNHFYAVRFNSRGFYCGYVRVANEENFNKINEKYNNGYVEDIDCHGGITYVSSISDFLPPGNWIGFDACHAGDKPDIEFATQLFNLDKDDLDYIHEFYSIGIDATSCSREYISDECKYIIDKLIEKYND